MISQKKWQQLADWMAQLDIKESGIEEQFILGSGSGGQKVNKTASCVLLTHTQSGLQIKCQQSSSREANRYYARKRLCEKIDEAINEKKSKKRQQIEKIRKQKQKQRKRHKDIEEQRHRAKIKANRRPPAGEID